MNTLNIKSKKNIMNSLCYGVITILLLLLVFAFSFSIANLTPSDDAISLIKNNKNEYVTFLDSNNPSQMDYLDIILDKAVISIKETKIINLNNIQITLDISVPSFSSSIIKLEPSLFTYNNINYVNNKIKSIGEEEYINNISSRLKNELLTTKTYYTDTVIVNIEKKNGVKKMTNYENLENILLGGIYGYQNNNVSFLTFNDLIFPQSSGSSQSAVSVTSILDVQSTSGTTYSTPDFLIKRGEIASYQGNIDLPDGTKSSARLNITVIDVKKSSKNTSVKIKIKSENDIAVSPQYFQIAINNKMIRPETNDIINSTKDSTEWTLIYNTTNDIDYITFNSSLFFA